MSAPRDPAALAKSIVAKDPDLRALLLRLTEDRWGGPTCFPPKPATMRSAVRMGLVDWNAVEDPSLTVIGREVAEHCRPPKWTAAIRNAYSTMDERAQYVAIDQPDGTTGFSTRSDGGEGQRHAFDRAQRVVDLLNADDLARAKVYGAKP